MRRSSSPMTSGERGGKPSARPEAPTPAPPPPRGAGGGAPPSTPPVKSPDPGMGPERLRQPFSAEAVKRSVEDPPTALGVGGGPRDDQRDGTADRPAGAGHA